MAREWWLLAKTRLPALELEHEQVVVLAGGCLELPTSKIKKLGRKVNIRLRCLHCRLLVSSFFHQDQEGIPTCIFLPEARVSQDK